ncbi:MAG: LacI family DNA-binding transcriptional regulator [Succinivibrio sp.]|nr:LacI family DNA-binding transcriptional regulator [Succinivibrio sp.]
MVQIFNPPVTAIVQPVEQIGSIAANNLIKRITGENTKVEQVCLQSMLLTRASTAAI